MSEGLAVQGVAFTELAETFGTPLYVYDSQVLTDHFTAVRGILPEEAEVFFSLKANPNVSVCAVFASAGAGAEVSSLTELHTARRAGIPPEKIIFLGPGKSFEELDACVEAGICAIVCESFGELEAIDELARRRNTTVDVALRVNPSFTVKGSKLTMGGRPRQFGLDEAQLLDHPDLAAKYPGVRLMGVHVYMGTRILSEEVVAENTARILELADRIASALGFPLEIVDIGGGLGVGYFDNERDLDLTTLDLAPLVNRFRAAHPGTRVIMELGRYLTALAGTYMARVRYTKTSMGENFAVTDGGTHHHMAAVGIGSFVKRNFPTRLLNRAAAAPTERWQITGPLCTPNDLLGKNVELPALRPGDLIGILRSGAYGPTASPTLFLSHGCPAEVLVHEGVPYLVRDRDRPQDLLARQHLHPAFAPR
ncbi:type III PLP-dependent enzyme [Streptomyces olivaceoviridis]